jgi:transcriptional regulator ATRX
LVWNDSESTSEFFCFSGRIVLTGTPLQNNMKEYYVMVDFVKPNLLGSRMEYMNRFAIPIVHGQFADSSIDDVRMMKHRSMILHRMLEPTIHRRDYEILAPLLPPKHEFILSIRLTDLQVKLYDYYMKHLAYDINSDGPQDNTLFADFNALQRVWTHPLVLRYASDRYVDRQKALQRKAARMRAAEGLFDDEEEEEEENGSDDEAGPGEMSPFADDDESDAEIPTPRPSGYNPTEWWMSLVPDDALTNMEYSGKFMMLMAILEECDRIGDKLLVFSQSLYTLDALEYFLRELNDQNKGKSSEEQKFKGSWKIGLDYFRLDGRTPSDQRLEQCNEFNRPDNFRTR